MRKIIIASIVVLMGINVSILTDVIDIDVLTLSKLEKAFAWDIEYPETPWDDDDDDDDDDENDENEHGNDNSGAIEDPYDCEDFDENGVNLLEGHSGVDCISVLVCPGCYCYTVTCGD